MALFFFLLTLDDLRAVDLSQQAWKKYLDMKSRNPKDSDDSVMVMVLAQFWEKLKDEPRTGVSKFNLDSGWLIPGDIKIQPWCVFHRTASREEIWMALLCQILRLPISRVSDLLGLSQGTIRYRLSRAVKKMGRIALEQGGFI
ncbi:MAG: sigma factor-like helix-turn-helix DNA-binding protein [Bdellovibrionales bacterium]